MNPTITIRFTNGPGRETTIVEPSTTDQWADTDAMCKRYMAGDYAAHGRLVSAAHKQIVDGVQKGVFVRFDMSL